MKYLITGIFTLFVTILVSRIFIALDLIDLSMFSSTEEVQVLKTEETSVKKLKVIGKQTYQIFCSSCHGMNGKGNNGKAQDHTKRISEKSIIDIIKNGSNNFQSKYPAGMPAALLAGDDVKEVAQYVEGGMKGNKPKSWAICATCHDESGEGISFIAPNIKNYSNELVATVLTNGKKGVIGTMPNFGKKLTNIQKKGLAIHIRGLAK